MSTTEKLVERINAMNRRYIRKPECKATLSEAAAALEAKDARIAELEAALTFIRLADWGWSGGGSDVRVPGRYSRFASQVLGLSEQLPLGWPSEEETQELRFARRAASARGRG